MSEFRSIVAAFPCQVHWGDCDPAGIIFYPTYFRWMDAAAWALLDAVGYSAKRMRSEQRAMTWPGHLDLRGIGAGAGP